MYWFAEGCKLRLWLCCQPAEETPDARKHVPKNSSKNRAKFGHNSGKIRAVSGVFGFSPKFRPIFARIAPELCPKFTRFLTEFCPTFLTPFFGDGSRLNLPGCLWTVSPPRSPGSNCRCPDSPTLKGEGDASHCAESLGPRGGST